MADSQPTSRASRKDPGGSAALGPIPANFLLREDESADALFYSQARLVTHIDDATIRALTAFYAEFLPPGGRILDLMSSWVSHLPDEDYAHVAGLGMNAEELAANMRLDEWVVHDLNAEPRLPFGDAAFDRAVIAVSVQYLIRPVEVFTDLKRVLAPGGRVAVAISHRCFPTKAIMAFRALPPRERLALVAVYLDRAGFGDLAHLDRSPPNADPLWIVTGSVPNGNVA